MGDFMKKKPVMLMILDGFGLTDKVEGNAVKAACKPNIDYYFNNYSSTSLGASGMSVGLPQGQMGNSEVGHLNIGAGRIIYQELTRITKEIQEKNFYKNEALLGAMENAKKNGSALHLMGLLSDGGVHSHISHLKALVKMAKENGIDKVFIHCFMDGRDVAPNSGEGFLKDLENFLKEEGIGSIATVMGRYYAMDRDNRWERVNLAYNAMVLGIGENANSSMDAITRSYSDNKTDEFVLPTVIIKEGAPVGKIANKDSVIFFNFRPDRAREITRAINDKVFEGFNRETLDLYYVTMTQYDITLQNVHVAYTPQTITNTLGEYISNQGKNQLRIAETEKYAHVTFFFNGGVEAPNKNEDRALIPSPKVATYDLKPEMSAFEVTEEALKRIDMDKYDCIILNFANPDMVGHTGVFEAAKAAVETVDVCLDRIVKKILDLDGTVFITADHGNSEQMVVYGTDNPMTAHTTNRVPFVYVSKESKELREGGILADIAPTILQIMQLKVPEEMTGKSLIK